MSAIATILGLLLVVTFIANYLATTLPNQMAVNDLDHDLQVENQLGHFAQALETVSAGAVVGAPLSQPVSLGSQGAPPFANPDGGSITPLANTTRASLSFGVVSTQYSPPGGWVAGGTYTSGCSQTPAQPNVAMNISCNGAGNQVHYNFNNCPSGCSLSATAADTFWGNYSVNSSTISVTQTGGSNGFEHIELVGSYDALSVKGTGGGGDIINVTIVGNFDTLSVTDSSQATVRILLVGLHDSVTFAAAGSSNSLFLVGWGAYDSYTTSSGSGAFRVYYTGFDPTAPTTPICPYGSLSQTDTVTGGMGTVTYNTTMPAARAPGWTYFAGSGQSTCIFFPSFPSTPGRTIPGASLLVQLRNTYAPSAEVVFDEGAVVYAQAGGYPVLIDPPPISFAYGIATVWLPAFVPWGAGESGIGTAMVSTHLVSVQRYSFPGGGWVLIPGQNVTLTYTTPYGSAWYASSFAIAMHAAGGSVTCAPLTSKACTGPYEPGGPLATVQITLPATMLTLNVATFSLALS